MVQTGSLCYFYDFSAIFVAMSERLKKITGEYILHPFLIGLYFVLYGINQYETLFIEAKDVLILLAMTTLLSVVVFFGFRMIFALLFRSNLNTKKILFIKTAIFTSTLLAFILFYFHFYYNVLKIDFLNILRQHKHFLALFLILFVAWCAYLFKSKKTYTVFNQYLNTLFLLLLLFESIKIGWNYYQTQQWYPAIQEEYMTYTGQNLASDEATKPSVYHILLDAYTGFDGLKKHWNYDNAEFKNYLEKKGFYVAEHAQGNYAHTRQVVPSMMNRDYFWDFENPDGRETAPAYLIALTGIRHARTFKDFEAMGYEMINLSIFDMLEQAPRYEYSGIPETSFLGFMLRKTVADVYFTKKRLWTHHEAALEILEEVKQIPARVGNRPVYVYAHLMIPHYPYYFDREGKLHKDREGEKNWSNKAHYLDQLIYTNELLKDAIDHILVTSATPPVIIVHGDHGFRFLEGAAKDEAGYSILAAFHFPEKNYAILRDSISPVNFYRATLDACFDTNMGLLPDERERYRKAGE